MPERDMHRAIQGKARFRIAKEANLGTIQGFPQLMLIKQKLGIQTLRELEAKSECWLISNGVAVNNLKNFLRNKGYEIRFQEVS